MQVAVNRDDYEAAISDYEHIAELAGRQSTPGEPLAPPQAVIQSRLYAVKAMQTAWRQQAVE